MTPEKQTLDEWHAELGRLAAPHDWPLCDYPDEYYHAWQEGTTPADYLVRDMNPDEEDT